MTIALKILHEYMCTFLLVIWKFKKGKINHLFDGSRGNEFLHTFDFFFITSRTTQIKKNAKRIKTQIYYIKLNQIFPLTFLF